VDRPAERLAHRTQIAAPADKASCGCRPLAAEQSP
jgi:hypothetical protein